MIAPADPPMLETERLMLRSPRAQDWEAWHPFAMSERAQYIGGPHTLGSAWRGFCHIAGMWLVRGYGGFIVTLKGDEQAIGMVGPWFPADWPEKELGWTLWRADMEGTGLMFEAASAARDFAFDVLDWDTAVSYIHRDNTRSVRLAERLGAVRDDAAERPHEEDLVYRHGAPA